MQAFMPDWDHLLIPNEGLFVGIGSLQGPEDVSVPDGHNLLCPPSSSDILQYLDGRANVLPRAKKATTDHWSVYGNFNFDFAETWRISLEGRYVSEREEQDVIKLDESDPDYSVRQSPSSIQPNCGIDPASPIPPITDDNGDPIAGEEFGRICGPTIPADVGLDGIWRSPLTFVDTVATRTQFFTPRATLEWRPVDQQMYYVSYAVGKKPGGFSRLTGGSGGFEEKEALYTEETLKVYELGAKTTLFDSHVLFNAAGYFQDFTDKQVPTTLINARTGLSTAAVENAAKAEIWGLEVELTWVPTDRVNLGLAYNYLESEYKDFVIQSNSLNDLTRASSQVHISDDPIVGTGAYRIGNSCSNPSARPTKDFNGDPVPDLRCDIDLSGNQLEDVPKHSLNLNGGYTAPFLVDGWEWYLQGEYIFQDERFLEQWNDNQLESYSIVNARFGLMSDSWEAVFYVDNVFDDETVRTAQTGPGISTGNFIDGPPRVRNQVIAYPAPPRVMGLRIKYTFGG
jgi:outer membrane receptor protein involved in Fe transport